MQASTLGSLEALLEFLRSQKEPIPVSSIAIGPIHRKDVMRAKVMLEKVCMALFCLGFRRNDTSLLHQVSCGRSMVGQWY